MQVVDHVQQHISSAWPSHSSPRPTESTPLLAGSSSNPLHSKVHSTRVFTGWNKTAQNRIRGKAHPTKHRKKASIIRSPPSPERDLESSQDHRYSTSSGQIPPPSQRFNARSPSGGEINSLDGRHPGPTDTKPCPTETLLPESSRSSLPISLCLQNSGSVARDHLASERTFLAYVRTSLAIVSAGVALVQLFSAASTQNRDTHRLHVYIRPLGATAVITGLSVLFIGVARYFMIQSALTRGYFPVARLATGFIAMVLSVLVTLTFGILLAGKLEPKK